MSAPTPSTGSTLSPVTTFMPALPKPKRTRKPAGVGAKIAFWVAVGWVTLLILTAVFAQFIPGLPSYQEKIGPFALQPGFDNGLGGLLGTDGVGRSTLSRIIYGARISLTIAIVSTAIGLVIGLVIGMLAGYYRGIADGGATIFANTVASLPPLLLLLALISAIGASLFGITIALGLVISNLYIRVTRGAVIANANREYVLAARALGATDARILIKEILPNLIPVLGAVIPVGMAIMIVVEGSLSFLGYGIPAPDPSWGGMIAAGSDIIRVYPWVVFPPIGALFLTVLSFNTIGDYLGRRTDVRTSQL